MVLFWAPGASPEVGAQGAAWPDPWVVTERQADCLASTSSDQPCSASHLSTGGVELAEDCASRW
jgi:hypothetical protein